MQNRSSLLNFKNQKNSEICTFLENQGLERGEQKGKTESERHRSLGSFERNKRLCDKVGCVWLKSWFQLTSILNQVLLFCDCIP